MAARGRCPECGSESLVEDAHYAQQQLVCAACGCVLSEGLLTTTYTDEEHLREVAYSQSTGQKEQLSRCLQRGIRRVQDLCKVLQLPAVFEETAVSYFQRALQLPAFRLVSLEKKELLGGCCVFVTCRQRNWPLTMGTVCSLLYAKQDLFASVYLSLQKELELSVPALSLADLVTTHLNSFRLLQPTANIPAPFLEDKEKLLARTMAIVELASETWLVTGRHPVPIVTAAAFLAWQSLRPGPRLSCPLARFCRLAGVDLPPPAHLRLKELLEILLGMASQLSWLRGFDLDRKVVVKHIGDLLQHRVFLLKNAFSQQGEEQQDTAPGSLDKGSLDKGSPGQDSPDKGSLDKGSLNEDSPGRDSLDNGSPGQGSVGLGSVDEDSSNKGSLHKDSPGTGSPRQSSVDKGSLGKDSPGRDSLDKGSPGQGSVGPGSVDKDSLDKGSVDKDTLDKGSLDKGSPGQDSVGPSSLDKDSPDKDSQVKNSSGHGSPSSAPGTQQQGCPWAGPGRRGGPLRPLLPPCLIHPRKRLRPAAPSAPAEATTGDEPISDSEIEQYLRSPEEIHALRKARAWL
ncbi:transcription factor IIIB 50 kDa subunit isoform X2 [Catharus ustulatus]|uniref:Transcription factor IIIB 50 kDa subunit n=1 Tax=Catharus ustulatus TaxID=91951 RepID=A0A8C3Y0H9_CATUS|nr:transcription factor IIIB 50 kDa subunit isoform X2 [Catharus ustulatus]